MTPIPIMDINYRIVEEEPYIRMEDLRDILQSMKDLNPRDNSVHRTANTLLDTFKRVDSAIEEIIQEQNSP